MPALWTIVTEAIYDMRESDIFPRTFETDFSCLTSQNVRSTMDNNHVCIFRFLPQSANASKSNVASESGGMWLLQPMGREIAILPQTERRKEVNPRSFPPTNRDSCHHFHFKEWYAGRLWFIVAQKLGSTNNIQYSAKLWRLGYVNSLRRPEGARMRVHATFQLRTVDVRARRHERRALISIRCVISCDFAKRDSCTALMPYNESSERELEEGGLSKMNHKMALAPSWISRICQRPEASYFTRS